MLYMLPFVYSCTYLLALMESVYGNPPKYYIILILYLFNFQRNETNTKNLSSMHINGDQRLQTTMESGYNSQDGDSPSSTLHLELQKQIEELKEENRNLTTNLETTVIFDLRLLLAGLLLVLSVHVIRRAFSPFNCIFRYFQDCAL